MSLLDQHEYAVLVRSKRVEFEAEPLRSMGPMPIHAWDGTRTVVVRLPARNVWRSMYQDTEHHPAELLVLRLEEKDVEGTDALEPFGERWGARLLARFPQNGDQ